MHTYIHCSTVYNSKDLEPTRMPFNNRLNKENVAHIHHGILHSHKDKENVTHIHHGILHSRKKDEFMSFSGTCMNLETIILSKLTQEQETKHHMFSFISGY